MSITVSVLDRWGNESNKVVLPYEFVSGASSPSVLPAPFNQADVPRLGYISIVLRNGIKSEGSAVRGLDRLGAVPGRQALVMGRGE